MRTLERLIASLSPGWALRRASARASLTQIEQVLGGTGGYQAGKLNRLTRAAYSTRQNENAIPREQLARIRWAAWDLYRNNPHARKIVRTLEAKVVGRGLKPQSQAQLDSGEPDYEFRDRARELWSAAATGIDYAGLPGRGGQSFVDLTRSALRSVVLNGEVLYQWRRLSESEQQRRRLPIDLSIQLVHPERLADTADLPPGTTAARVFAGIELDDSGRRVAYWLSDHHPSDPLSLAGRLEARRVPADQIGHVYVAEDVDQLRGTSWFAPAVMQLRDTGDYQFNELRASAMAACVILGVRRPTGATQFGADLPSDWEITDADGNKLTAMQPGMIVDLGRDGEINGFNPLRPNNAAEAFINHMLRATSAALPGVKSSTVTGDYRQSSFSSERSADNDAWPELEQLQDWFAASFCQPIYERLIISGVESGWFDDVLTPSQFSRSRERYLSATWQGPVPRSINPVDDAQAARERIATGASSPQRECAAIGAEWREVLREIAEFRETALSVGLSPEHVDQMLSVPPQPEISDDDTVVEGAAAR